MASAAGLGVCSDGRAFVSVHPLCAIRAWQGATCTWNFLTHRVSVQGQWSSQKQRHRHRVAGECPHPYKPERLDSQSARQHLVAGGEARLSEARARGPHHHHPRAAVGAGELG